MIFTNDLREKLAKIEHEQWVAWSKEIAKVEPISDFRLERWKRLWNTPYEQLDDKDKVIDRLYADKVLSLILVSQDEQRKSG